MICVSNTLLEFVRELHLLSHEARPFILIQRRGYVACEGYSKLTLYLSPPPPPDQDRSTVQHNVSSLPTPKPPSARDRAYTPSCLWRETIK